jgi:hypothetical protein
MRAITRRLAQMEKRLLPVPDAPDLLRLRERMAAGNRRIAEFQALHGLPALQLPSIGDTRGLSIVEILQRGRDAARAYSLANEAAGESFANGCAPGSGGS